MTTEQAITVITQLELNNESMDIIKGLMSIHIGFIFAFAIFAFVFIRK